MTDQNWVILFCMLVFGATMAFAGWNAAEIRQKCRAKKILLDLQPQWEHHIGAAVDTQNLIKSLLDRGDIYISMEKRAALRSIARQLQSVELAMICTSGSTQYFSDAVTSVSKEERLKSEQSIQTIKTTLTTHGASKLIEEFLKLYKTDIKPFLGNEEGPQHD